MAEKNGRIKANSDLAGGGLGAVIAWAYAAFIYQPEWGQEAVMTASVAAAMAPVIGRIVRYIASWFPTADKGD